jgi:ATP-dependent Clp protease ATP-binding subunit ClpA
VLFNDINKEMAALILDKKINELRSRIKARKITLELTQQATDELLRRGFSPQYGAREIDRVINSTINPLLTKEILFGSLKNGGHTTLDFVNGEMILSKTTA